MAMNRKALDSQKAQVLMNLCAKYDAAGVAPVSLRNIRATFIRQNLTSNFLLAYKQASPLNARFMRVQRGQSNIMKARKIAALRAMIAHYYDKA